MPVSNASAALALVAKYSRLSTDSRTFRHDVLRVKRATDAVWEGSVALKDLDDMDAGGKASSQFISEGSRGAARNGVWALGGLSHLDTPDLQEPAGRNRFKETANCERNPVTVHNVVDESSASNSDTDFKTDCDSDGVRLLETDSEDDRVQRPTRASYEGQQDARFASTFRSSD